MDSPPSEKCAYGACFEPVQHVRHSVALTNPAQRHVLRTIHAALVMTDERAGAGHPRLLLSDGTSFPGDTQWTFRADAGESVCAPF